MINGVVVEDGESLLDFRGFIKNLFMKSLTFNICLVVLICAFIVLNSCQNKLDTAKTEYKNVSFEKLIAVDIVSINRK